MGDSISDNMPKAEEGQADSDKAYKKAGGVTDSTNPGRSGEAQDPAREGGVGRRTEKVEKAETTEETTTG